MKLARPNDPEQDMFNVDTAPTSGSQACHSGISGGSCQAGNWDCKSFANYPLGQQSHFDCDDARDIRCRVNMTCQAWNANDMNLINKNFVRDLCTIRKCYVDPFMHGNWAYDLEPFFASRLRKSSPYSPRTTIDDNDLVGPGVTTVPGTQHTMIN
jgi:hypothetical protein